MKPNLTREADLTRIVRHLLRMLKEHVLENASISVSVDYDDTPGDGLSIVALAKLPALVLSGPRISQNRFCSTNVRRYITVGVESHRYSPPYTVDLEFTLTGASERTVELLNLLSATARFLATVRHLELDRDPGDADAGTVRWELDPSRDIRTSLRDDQGVRVFTCGFVVRGFDLDEGKPIHAAQLTDDVEVETTSQGE